MAGAIAAAAWLLVAACAPRITRVADLGESALAAAKPESTKTSAPVKSDVLRAPEDRPVQITSDRLQYTEQGQVTVFTGHVRVRQGAALLEAPYLEVRSVDQQAFARHGIRLVDHERGVTMTARELDYVKTLDDTKARGNVRLASHDERGEPLHLRSETLAWNTESKTARATGQVMVTYRQTTATAQAMNYRQADQVLDLWTEAGAATGRPRIESDGNTLVGDALRLNLRERSYEARGSARADVTLRGQEPSSGKEKP